jgi:hypothetical protein
MNISMGRNKHTEKKNCDDLNWARDWRDPGGGPVSLPAPSYL